MLLLLLILMHLILLLLLLPLPLPLPLPVQLQILSTTLAKANTVVVHRLLSFGWRSAFDRAVVTAGRIGMIAELIRVPATFSRSYRLVRSILVRQMIHVRVVRLLAEVRLCLNPSGAVPSRWWTIPASAVVFVVIAAIIIHAVTRR